MERVDFYELSRVVQDRFVASTRGVDVPAPIVAVKGTGDRMPLVWLAVSVVSAAAFVVCVLRGFGDLKSAMSIQTPVVAAIEAALAVVFVLGILQALARWALARSLPFRPGIFVFPAQLIDARSHRMRVFPIEELEGVDESSGAIRVKTTDGSTFTFPGAARQAAKELSDARVEVKELGPRPDPSARIRLDPLYEPRFSSPLGPKHPFRRVVPAWIKGRFLVALLVGAAIGVGAWGARNMASDDKMFADAKKRDEVGAYEEYLKYGKRHRAEVADELLPRAELRVAIAAKSVDAIESYVAAHPRSKIGDEVSTALRAAMLAELEKAKQAGTLAALDAFAKAHPDHHLDPELAAATHAVYAAALEKYKTLAPLKGSADEIAFVAKLLDWSEKKSPSVEIRFRYAPSKNLKTVDKVVAKNPSFNGEQSYPSKYFDPADLRPREQDSANAIAARFADAFAPELLKLAPAAPLQDADTLDAPVPPVTVPTLVVTHMEEWSGTALVSKQPRGIFVGIQVSFDALFFVPGDAKPYKLHYVSVRNVPPDLLKELGKEYPPKQPPEKPIYETMAKDAFQQFTDKLLGSFFKSSP